MVVPAFFGLLFSFFLSAVQAVTLTSTSSSYTINADSANSFQFTVNRANCDITSIVYRGSEVQYQGGSYSQISSGLGSATVSASPVTYSGTNYVKITCSTSTLTHYYVVRNGDSSLHMATYTTAEPSVGELRYEFPYCLQRRFLLTCFLQVDRATQPITPSG